LNPVPVHDAAEYTPQEISRLQLGWLVREREASQTSGSDKTKYRRRQRQAREEMVSDLAGG
jgi:hypothetical protein